MRSIRYIVFSRFFLVGLVFLLCVGGLAYTVGDRMVSRFFVQDNERLAHFIARNIATHYWVQLRALDTLANLDGFRGKFEATRARDAVDTFVQLNPAFDTVHVYQADGKLLLGAKRGVESKAYSPRKNFLEKPERDFIGLAQEALSTGKPQIGEMFASASGRAYQAYFVPLIQPGSTKPYAVISGGAFLNNSGMVSLLEGLELDEGNFIAVTDTKGKMLFQKGWKEGSEQTHFVFSVSLGELKRVVLLGASKKRMTQKRDELFKVLLLSLPLGFLLSLLTSHLIGNQLSRPLHQVIKGVRRLNEGDCSFRIDYKKKDEIGYLCESINDLAGKIGKAQLLGELWSSEAEEP